MHYQNTALRWTRYKFLIVTIIDNNIYILIDYVD